MESCVVEGSLLLLVPLAVFALRAKQAFQRTPEPVGLWDKHPGDEPEFIHEGYCRIFGWGPPDAKKRD